MTVGRLQAAGPGGLPSASRRIEVLDALGVAYEVGATFDNGNAGVLLWPDGPLPAPGAYSVGGTPLFARVLQDDEIERRLDGGGIAWRRELEIVDADGRGVSAIRRREDGSVLLPFDPDDPRRMLLQERYLELTTPAIGRKTTALARSAYYRARPLLPRRAQIAMRRRFARVQERTAFPRWPAETALHDFYDLLLGLVDEIAGESVPRLAPWPDGKSWAFVLTHDVETATGYGRIEAVLDAERRHDLRSAWFFVPERDYQVQDEQVAQLSEQGFEVALHGLRHDGHDLDPGEIRVRLPAMRTWAERWGATGFRAPATHRRWDLMPQLGFDYDSSYSDVARYEPQAGGSCSWLPFFIDDLVELPITMPMDHTLFDILGDVDGSAWREKAALLRERGGMAVMLTHPDYLDETRLREYEYFLEAVAGDETAWFALPRDVSAWWRRRAASRIVRSGDDWIVEGPAAAQARIEFGAPPRG